MEGRGPVPERTVLSAEWKIKKRSRACAACNRLFSEGERYHSALKPGGDGFHRSDYCTNCWANLGEGVEKLFSFWQGVFLVEQPTRRPEAIESSRAENLFARLLRSAEPSFLKLAYVFALLLERKRKLVRKGRAERDGRSYVIYEHTGTAAAYLVEDININLREAEGIQRELNKILAGEGIRQTNAQDSSLCSGNDQ